MSQNTKKPYDLPDWPAEAEQTQEAPRPRRKRRAPAEPEDLWGKLRFRAGKKVRWFGRRCRRVVREAQAHRFPESNRKPLQFLLMLWGLLPSAASRLREILLGLHSMCRGAESKFFNGPTNITTSRFLVFGVKGLLQANSGVKNAMLFNVLSYLSDRLLTEGNAVATLDELYIWLSNLTTIEYIRNTLKRVRKKESSMILASQNLEDFDVQGIRELTRPLFAIPTHQFLFNAGSVNGRFYMDNLQLEPAEFELIRYAQRGVCLYKCGNERYLLEVHAPPHKEGLFGKAGGR